MAVEGWASAKLGVHIEKIVGGGTPSRKSPEYWGDEIPWATVKDLKSYFPEDTQEKITSIGLKNSASNLIPPNTLILSTRMAVGKAVRFNKPVSINQDLKALFIKKSLDVDFLHQWFRANETVINALGSGSTVKGIRLEALTGLDIDLPPIYEQKKIAEILGNVDEAIVKTEAVIAQTQLVKQGLLQTLLTKGIGHTKFKQTEIGEIPESWELSSIEEISDRVTSGSRGWAEYYSEEGAAFIRITNLKRDCIYPDMSDLKRVKLPDGSAEGIRTRIRTGDMLISITADLGIIGYIEDDRLGEAYINQHISLVSLDPKKINSGYAAYFLSTPFMQRYIQKLNDGGAKAGLNLQTIRKLPLPLPEMKEQVRIFKTLEEIDKRLIDSKKNILALQGLKKGVMSDLLTGRVRVKLDKKRESAA